jgi:hypothetical protein
MSSYPVARHPADNASLRPYYGGPFQTLTGYVNNNGVSTSSVWFLFISKEILARYNVLFESENPPTIHTESLERTGATFYPYCMLYTSYILDDFNLIVIRVSMRMSLTLEKANYVAFCVTLLAQRNSRTS